MNTKSKRKRLRPVITYLKDTINDMSEPERKQFAKKCGTSVDNLRQIAYGWGGCSLNKAKKIVLACDNKIDLGDLIPELKETTYSTSETI